jgi:hypothetical protein
MIKKIKDAFERLKKFSLYITNLFAGTIGYWLGISLSFLLWKATQLRKKKSHKTFWSNLENSEENYKSQY